MLSAVVFIYIQLTKLPPFRVRTANSACYLFFLWLFTLYVMVIVADTCIEHSINDAECDGKCC